MENKQIENKIAKNQEEIISRDYTKKTNDYFLKNGNFPISHPTPVSSI